MAQEIDIEKLRQAVVAFIELAEFYEKRDHSVDNPEHAKAIRKIIKILDEYSMSFYSKNTFPKIKTLIDDLTEIYWEVRRKKINDAWNDDLHSRLDNALLSAGFHFSPDDPILKKFQKTSDQIREKDDIREMLKEPTNESYENQDIESNSETSENVREPKGGPKQIAQDMVGSLINLARRSMQYKFQTHGDLAVSNDEPFDRNQRARYVLEILGYEDFEIDAAIKAIRKFLPDYGNSEDLL